jgi:hypothetical protein
MKVMTHTSFKGLIGGLLMAALTSIPSVTEAQQRVVHSVSGSGLTVVEKDFFFPGSPAFTFRNIIAATLHADGTVSGKLVVHVIQPPEAPITLVGDITCLTFEGKTVFYGATIIKTTNPGYSPVGTEAVGFVTDTDGDGPDISWGGPSIFFLQPGQTCADHPIMPQQPISSGNFVVR